ncbi:hypothetical protein EK21DRAFT_95489 [Setomelanomma holmii]|uniref:Uncharacterized protein n=1 Tax=Setomelanomma holmii TaxID=210430 RepID=A0A9P4LFZ2_9PLEO|nr:hypothetical protein EK21DRAFT_95489 [Setomelanomma holmii]
MTVRTRRLNSWGRLAELILKVIQLNLEVSPSIGAKRASWQGRRRGSIVEALLEGSAQRSTSNLSESAELSRKSKGLTVRELRGLVGDLDRPRVLSKFTMLRISAFRMQRTFSSLWQALSSLRIIGSAIAALVTWSWRQAGGISQNIAGVRALEGTEAEHGTYEELKLEEEGGNVTGWAWEKASAGKPRRTPGVLRQLSELPWNRQDCALEDTKSSSLYRELLS